MTFIFKKRESGHLGNGRTPQTIGKRGYTGLVAEILKSNSNKVTGYSSKLPNYLRTNLLSPII